MDITQDKTFVIPHRVGGNGVYSVMDTLESRTTRKLEDFLDSLGSGNDVWIQCLLYQQETLTLPHFPQTVEEKFVKKFVIPETFRSFYK